MCRMRSVRETAKFFKEMDPKTEITETTLRKMISEGTIKTFKTGNKYLINIDLLLEMFSANTNGCYDVVCNNNHILIEK